MSDWKQHKFVGESLEESNRKSAEEHAEKERQWAIEADKRSNWRRIVRCEWEGF